MEIKIKHLLIIAVFILAAIFLRPQTVLADDPCILDRANLCGTIEPGKGRVLNCMDANIDNLAPACQKVVAQTDAQVKKVRNACATDIQRFCAIQPADPNSRIACLKQFTDQVSQDCHDSYQKLLALPYQPDF